MPVSYTHLDVYKRQLESEEGELYERNESVWANRANKFFNENTIVGNTQREELWAVVELSLIHI